MVYLKTIGRNAFDAKQDPKEAEKELRRRTEINSDQDADYEQEHFAKLILSLHSERAKKKKN